MNFSSRLLTSFLRFVKALLGLLMIVTLKINANILRDDPEMWSFDDDKETSTFNYFVMLEKRAGIIEQFCGYSSKSSCNDHLKKKVRELEKEKVRKWTMWKLNQVS